MRRTHFIFFVIVSLTTLLQGTARAQQAVFPRGLTGSDVVRGLYPGTDAGNCCWIGTYGEIRPAVPHGADTLLFNLYIPAFAVKGNGQSLRVQIDDAVTVTKCCLGAGEHEVTLPLPQQARHGPVTVRIWPSATFVPKAIGLNQDPRQLSVMLRNVGFLNSATGERLDQSVLPGLPPRSITLLLLLAGAAIVWLTLRRPLYGVVALIVTDPFLLAYSFHGTTGTLPKVALIAVAIGIAPRLIKQKLRPRALQFLVYAQLFLILTMLPGSVHALFRGAAAREILKAVEYLGTILVAYSAYRLDPGERAMRLSLAVTTIAVSVLAFAGPIFAVGEAERIAGLTLPRIAGPLEGPNQFSGFLGAVVPAMLAFAVLRPRVILERIAIGLGAAACLMTFSRGGVAALVIAAAVLLAVRYAPAYRRIVAGATTAIFGIALALAFGVAAGVLHGHVASVFGGTGEGAFNGGLGSRSDLWHGAYALFRSHPLFGIGAGNFELQVGRFYPGVQTHANSIFFQTLAEQGILGLLALLAVVAASVVTFIRDLDEPLALGACMAAVAMAFHQIVDCMWLYPKIGTMWWVILAVGAAVVDARRQGVSSVSDGESAPRSNFATIA